MNRITKFVSEGVTYTFPETETLSDNFANMVPRTMRLPGVDGGLDLRGNARFEKEIGNVRFSFTVRDSWAKREYSLSDGDEALQKARDEIARLMYRGMGKLYQDTGQGERWTWAKVNNVQMPTNYVRNTDLWQPVTMNLQAALPFWFEQGTETASNWGEFTWGDGTPWGGSATPQAVSGTSTEWAETYSDGIAPTLVRVSIVAGAGGIENPTLQRIVDGTVIDEVSWTGTMTSTQELQIHSRAKQVQLDGVDEYANFDYETPEWFRLLPGSNTIKLLMANAGDEGNVYLRYFEVY